MRKATLIKLKEFVASTQELLKCLDMDAPRTTTTDYVNLHMSYVGDELVKELAKELTSKVKKKK